MIVLDPQGREWNVKQPSGHHGAEGPVEVVLSRVLSALGYHQPPVYYLPSFTMRDASGLHTETGGRFRLTTTSLNDRGEWSWQQNPFVGTAAVPGPARDPADVQQLGPEELEQHALRVQPAAGGPRHWYVVRDLGDALGETGRFSAACAATPTCSTRRFINGVNGWLRGVRLPRLAPGAGAQPDHAATTCGGRALLTGITIAQWQDAFRAGGYPPASSDASSAILHRARGRSAPRAEQAGLDANRRLAAMRRRRCRLSCIAVPRRAGFAPAPATPRAAQALAGAARLAEVRRHRRQRHRRRPEYDIAQQMAAARAKFPFEMVIMLGDNMYGRQTPQDFVDKFERPVRGAASGRRPVLRVARQSR